MERKRKEQTRRIKEKEGNAEKVGATKRMKREK